MRTARRARLPPALERHRRAEPDNGPAARRQRDRQPARGGRAEPGLDRASPLLRAVAVEGHLLVVEPEGREIQLDTIEIEEAAYAAAHP